MANTVTGSFTGICRNNSNVYYNFTFKLTETEILPTTNSSVIECVLSATQVGTYTGVDRDIATTIILYINNTTAATFNIGLLQKGFSNTITKTVYCTHNSDGTASPASIKFLSDLPMNAIMERNVYESSKNIPQNLTLNLTTPIDRTANGCSASLASKTSDSITCKINIPWDHSANYHSTDGQNFTFFGGYDRTSREIIDTWSGLSPNTTYTFYYKITREYNWVTSDIFSITVSTTNEEQATGYIKVNGEWKKGKLYYKVNGSWQKVRKAYTKVNGVWKESK